MSSVDADTWSRSTPINGPFGYNAQWGYYFDREHSYYLCGHRYYDHDGGRWLTRDPIGYAGGINLYSYCGQGPVGSIDISGTRGSTAAEVVELGEMAAEAAGGIETAAGRAAAAQAMRAATPVLPPAVKALLAAGTAALPAALADPNPSAVGTKTEKCDPMLVYRVYGDNPYPQSHPGPGAVPYGRSWSPNDPREDPNYAWNNGLPYQNGGTMLIIGVWSGRGAILRPALPNDDYPASGGAPEIYFPAGPLGHVTPVYAGPLSPPVRFPILPRKP